jgi:hypothetical protein
MVGEEKETPALSSKLFAKEDENGESEFETGMFLPKSGLKHVR